MPINKSSTKNTVKARIRPEYELKHRVTGAAIIVLFAVVVIPMLLQDPSIDVNAVSSSKIVVQEDSTFKSKIKPLNLNNSNQTSDNQQSDLKPALLDTREVTSSDDAQQNSKVGNNNQVQQEQLEVVKDAEQNTTGDQTKLVFTPEPAKEPNKNTEVAALDNNIGNQGWTVRVGTFSKQENIQSVSDLLNSSGFNARHTKVQTTLGEATRVWLGPYLEKKTAEKVSTRLKNLTGEKGYVTKHTS